MKRCSACGETKPRSDFYAKSGSCKPCCISKSVAAIKANRERHREWQRANYAQNRERVAEQRAKKRLENLDAARAKARAYFAENREAIAAYTREWRRNNATTVREYTRQWTAKNKDKSVAHYRVKRALKDGSLTRQPCEVCGAPGAHAHHDDYSKPLEVRWLCPPHHVQHHTATKAAAAEIYV